MSDYKKMKSHELAELLVRRGLDASGPKVQMISRLVMQDAEQISADRALAAAIQAASNSPSPQPDAGAQNAESKGEWSKVKKGGADRGGAEKESEKMRKARLEKGKRGVKGKGKEVGGGGFYGLLGGEDLDVEVDDEAIVRELLAGGSLDGRRKAGPETYEQGGIRVNMTEEVPKMRGGAGRVRTQRKVSYTRPVADNDDVVSDTSTVRPSSVVAPERIPLPQDDSDLEKSGKTGKKRKAESKKNGTTGVQPMNAAIQDDAVREAAVQKSSAAMTVFLWAVLIAAVYIFFTSPGSFLEVVGYLVAFVKDPVGTSRESIMGPK